MRVSKFVTGFFIVFAMVCGNISLSYAHSSQEYSYGEPETTIMAYDYLYDYDRGHWVRVNSYSDYLPCWKASQLVDDLRDSGFNVTYRGEWNCPTSVAYSVFHDSFYVSGFNYYNYWAPHHRTFHHTGVKVYFHHNVHHNNRHHYRGSSTYYNTKSYYKVGVKSRYRKWKKNNYNSVPVYHKNKKKPSYGKSSYKRTNRSKFTPKGRKHSARKGKRGAAYRGKKSQHRKSKRSRRGKR